MARTQELTAIRVSAVLLTGLFIEPAKGRERGGWPKAEVVPWACRDAGEPQPRGRAGVGNQDSSAALEEMLRSAKHIVPIIPHLVASLRFMLSQSLSYIHLGDCIFLGGRKPLHRL